MSSILDENIDPAVRATGSQIIPPRPITSPAVLPDGSLVLKRDFEAHLQTLKHKTTLRAACEELNISFAHITTLTGFREKLVNHWYAQPTPPVCCQAEIDAADSTAQDMLQDSDSEGEEDDEGEGEDSWDLDDDDDFQRFQTTTRVAAAQRSEGNRRIGGMKTQTSTVKICSSSTRHASNSRFEMM